MKMQFKDFVFPANPSKIEISSSSSCAADDIYDGSNVVSNISTKPVIVTGSGEFFGERAAEYCAVLSNMLRDRTWGWLFTPGAAALKAYFTDFSYERDCTKNSFAYTFKFVENCSDVRAKREITKVVAENGENAFDIANKCSVTVDDIMKLNDLKTPFDIKEGSEVTVG